MVTQAQKEATARYQKKAYDKILLTIRKDGTMTADMIKEAAQKAGVSVNSYILQAVRRRMDTEKVRE